MTTSFSFPLLGSLHDGDPFEYLLMGIKNDFVEILIADWLVNRVKLSVDDLVDLYIPEKVAIDSIGKAIVSEKVLLVVKSEEMRGFIYHVSIKERIVKNRLRDMSEKDQLLHLIKDSAILKEGVSVYLKHLIPYFSRIVNYSPEEYLSLKEYFFNDVLNLVQKNEDKLMTLHELLEKKMSVLHDLPAYVNLEELRALFETELSLSLFLVMFSEKKGGNMKELLAIDHNTGFAVYIQAIKFLEKRLYSNYNKIVFIYTDSLSM